MEGWAGSGSALLCVGLSKNVGSIINVRRLHEGVTLVDVNKQTESKTGMHLGKGMPVVVRCW